MMPYGGDTRNKGDTILGGTEFTPFVIYGTDGQVEEETNEPTQPYNLDDAQI